MLTKYSGPPWNGAPDPSGRSVDPPTGCAGGTQCAVGHPAAFSSEVQRYGSSRAAALNAAHGGLPQDPTVGSRPAGCPGGAAADTPARCPDLRITGAAGVQNSERTGRLQQRCEPAARLLPAGSRRSIPRLLVSRRLYRYAHGKNRVFRRGCRTSSRKPVRPYADRGLRNVLGGPVVWPCVQGPESWKTPRAE
jgi:hypothetical protein